jgi:hypothetical protein
MFYLIQMELRSECVLCRHANREVLERLARRLRQDMPQHAFLVLDQVRARHGEPPADGFLIASSTSPAPPSARPAS